MEKIQDIYIKPSNSGSEFTDFITSGENQSKEDSDRNWARCRNCNYRIALISDKINVNNAETHIFENPSGIFYRIICFADAPGTSDLTEYTEENTWFKGYSWSISLCRICNNHLGWHYSSGSFEFYGLIADRLAGI